MNQDLKFEAFSELFAALYMMANALYFQYVVRLCVKYFGAKGLEPGLIVKIRIAAGVFAIILGFMSLSTVRKAM
jgi:hypothetical protein